MRSQDGREGSSPIWAKRPLETVRCAVLCLSGIASQPECSQSEYTDDCSPKEVTGRLYLESRAQRRLQGLGKEFPREKLLEWRSFPGHRG